MQAYLNINLNLKFTQTHKNTRLAAREDKIGVFVKLKNVCEASKALYSILEESFVTQFKEVRSKTHDKK